MSVLDMFRKNTIKEVDVVNNEQYEREYTSKKVGTLEIPDKLTNENSFVLANTVAEIYHPIDFLADRASKLRFFIADKNGNEVQVTELNRFITDINPFYSFNDLVYQYLFSLLSDGNSFTYLGVPSSSEKITPNTITRCDILIPNLVNLTEYRNMSILGVSNRNDLVRKFTYELDKTLELNKLRINTYDPVLRPDSILLSRSPLFKSVRSVNNLLATYSARYNIYVNNGSAGYLVNDKKQTGSNIADVIDPTTREDMLKDINNRNGITGNRNLWGVSSIPLKFINTLSTIKDLLPFEETLDDSIKIAGTYQLPSGLVLRKDQSTFDNKNTDEKSVWENALISLVNTTCETFTRIFGIDALKYSIKADYSSVSVLKENEASKEDIKTKKIDNLLKIKQLSPDLDIEKEIKLILSSNE